MWDVLSAIIPPAVVAAVFCTAIYKLLRSEMAPRTSDGRRVSERPARRAEATTFANSDGAEATQGKPRESAGDVETERGGSDAERD
nr:hypothetical protein [Spiractinospora alimapuensis]